MGKRIIAQRRGKGGPGYISPSHKHHGQAKIPRAMDVAATVVDLEHAPGRSTPLATLKLPDGKEHKVIANEGLRLGQSVAIGGNAPVTPGNTTFLRHIPEGTPVFNVEGSPFDGGKFARAAGNYATVMGTEPGGRVIVQMPSGKTKVFHPDCRATIGVPAGGGHGDKPFVKAGKMFGRTRARATRWPIVRGVAMNPIDHPHGGGSHNYPGKPTSMARGTSPGRMVGKVAPRRTGRKKV